MFWKRRIKFDEQAVEIARLKTEVARLSKVELELLKANQSLKASLADNAVTLEERDDQIETLRSELAKAGVDALETKVKFLKLRQQIFDAHAESM